MRVAILRRATMDQSGVAVSIVSIACTLVCRGSRVYLVCHCVAKAGDGVSGWVFAERDGSGVVFLGHLLHRSQRKKQGQVEPVDLACAAAVTQPQAPCEQLGVSMLCKTCRARGGDMCPRLCMFGSDLLPWTGHHSECCRVGRPRCSRR